MSEPKHIFVLSTGGTIGMRRSDRGYRPESGFLATRMAAMPELHDGSLPRYTMVEHEPLLDSTNMTPADWVAIGEALVAHYDEADGFVVLHGTDTMAYTAAALSFMIEDLSKPIVLTGSQIPLVEVRNDARENLITSLLVAARDDVPEVCLFFGGRLLRGNRATKVSSSGFRAFASPNYPPLGTAGVHIEIDHDLIRTPPKGRMHFRAVERPQVIDVRLFPGVTPSILKQLLATPIQGAVLHTYGAGNAPDDPTMLRVLSDATKRGVVIVNCTQCMQGSVDMEGYATGTALAETGVISGYDMTPEAALTKLFYLLSLDLPTEAIRCQMQEDLRGELTRP